MCLLHNIEHGSHFSLPVMACLCKIEEGYKITSKTDIIFFPLVDGPGGQEQG